MKNRGEKIILIVVVAALGLLIGCVAFQKAITPAWIEEPAKSYAADANGALPFEIPRLWWTSILDAELVDKLLDYTHDQKQVLLERAKEDDRAWFALLKGQSQEHLKHAAALQQELFTPSGTVGALLLSGLGVYAGALGFSRPEDKREIEKLKNSNG